MTYDFLWFSIRPCIVEPYSLEVTEITPAKRKAPDIKQTMVY